MNGAKKANQRAKDAARAAYMKARGIVRETGRCAVCYRIVKLSGMHAHVAAGCRGGQG